MMHRNEGFNVSRKINVVGVGPLALRKGKVEFSYWQRKFRTSKKTLEEERGCE